MTKVETTNLQLEFIENEFQDCTKLATEIIGCLCASTTTSGDGSKRDSHGTKYQISPDRRSAKSSDRINIAAFENYFNDNFGKWKDRCYFDTPSQAFVSLIKAWHIWNKHLSTDIKSKYLDGSKKLYQGIN